MKNIFIGFNILQVDEKPSTMHNYMPHHMLFDVKMVSTCKYRYVATGCHIPKYDESLYAWVVSCESVRIALTYSDLNGIDIMAYEIYNSYHIAMPRECHIQQVYYTFVYLRKHHNPRLVFDPTYPGIE